MLLKQQILSAARATEIPTGDSGLWYIRKDMIPPNGGIYRDGYGIVEVPGGTYTHLLRWTDATIHLGRGECVMEDTPHELQKHLDFMLKAHGRVLITGLGLGCVTRGTLTNPRVTHVTVIENSPDVMKLVWPHMPRDQRLEIIQAEAEKWIETTSERFDCVWHDLWTDTNAGEEHLALKHSRMIAKMAPRTPLQGAWAMPRWFRRAAREQNSRIACEVI